MAILIRPHKHIRKARAGNGEEILAKLESYLKIGVDEPIRILCGFWNDQQAVITYQELRQAVIDGSLNEETFREWSKDYSFLVRERLQFLWKNAVVAGAVSQPIISGLVSYAFHADTPQVLSWISQRGSELVTAVAVEQREAISALLTQAVRERHSVDELARFIRPCIGLTQQQAKANLKYYDNVVRNLTELHPRMKAETIQRRAREAAAKYAERQHRQRALTIARTEMATAYNRGAYEGILQAQEQHLLGNMVQRWCTSNDDMVCDQCRALEGVELELGKEFPVKGKRGAACVTPPAHPNCACAIEYIEMEKPQAVPMGSLSANDEEADDVPEHDSPDYLGCIDNLSESVVKSVLEKYEQEIVHGTIEHAIVITKSGLVFRCYGTANQVFPVADLGDELRGAWVTHNHPIEETTFSFSSQDLQLFTEYELALLRGCDECYTYEFSWDSMAVDEFTEDWRNIENYHHNEMIGKAKEYHVGYRRWENDKTRGK